MDSSSSTKQKAPSNAKQPRLIACRECHRRYRSKLRCDREYPCKSCIKRGCADICPNGILVKVKRQKTSSLDATKLQEANESLNDRVRQLEEALASSHAQHTSDPHPLLTDRLFLSDPQARNHPHGKQPLGEPKDDDGAGISAYGTLAIGRDGQATFHGIAANPDALLESETKGSAEDHRNHTGDASSLPPEVLEMGRLFPFGTHTHSSAYTAGLKGVLVKYLPHSDKAWDLCNAWFEHGSWLNDPVPRAEFLSHIFNPIYKSTASEDIAPDHLAVLFILLALGSLLDLRKSFDQAATEPLYQLSCAAFCLVPIYETATIPAIQALHLLGVYLFMTNRQNLEYRWLIAGLASRLMESTGLHRNSETWIQNDPPENQRRCKVFWESYTWDIWQSFHTGRSPALSAPHIQCKMPLEVDQPIAHATCSYNAWKYQYRFRCLVPVMEEAFGARSPSHATILHLDRKIRDFDIPAMLRMPGLGGVPSGPPAPDGDDVPLVLTLQRYAVFCEREITLLHLHRSYFSQALHDSPANPLGNRHAASVFAAYRSASLIVSATQDLSLKHPELASRIWYIWSCLFSAATVLGNIVIRSPNCQLSSSALIELGVAAGLLETRTVRSRSAQVVPVVKQLQEKAQDVYKQHARKVEAARRSSSNNDLSMLTGGQRFAPPPERSNSSITSHSSESVSPPPELPTPEMFPPLHEDAFTALDSDRTGLAYIQPTSLEPGPCSGATEWLRLNTGEQWHPSLSSSSIDYDGTAPLTFSNMPANYPAWAHPVGHSSYEDPQTASSYPAGHLERGGFHPQQHQAGEDGPMRRPHSILQPSRTSSASSRNR